MEGRKQMLTKLQETFKKRSTREDDDWINIQIDEVASFFKGYSFRAMARVFNEIIIKQAVKWKNSHVTEFHRDKKYLTVTTTNFREFFNKTSS